MLPEIGLVLLLALLNGFFALSEIAIVASRKGRLKQHTRNSARARAALALVEHPERLLSTVQVGITLIGIVIGAATGATLGTELGSHLEHLGLPILATYAKPLGMLLAVALVTFINIIIGELVPKRVALVAPEKIATQVALPMTFLSRLAAPMVWLLNSCSNLILRLLGLHGKRNAVISEEEIRMLVAESAEQGVLDSDERNMVSRVLRLGDRNVESVMTPRPRIAWLDAEASVAQNLAVLTSTPYSRFPVFRGDESEICGILEVKTLVEELARSERDSAPAVNLFRDLAKPLFVPESSRALDLFEEFREARTGLALVVDEYGDIVGLVTINDLLGTVVGRVPSSEQDDPRGESPVVQRADGSYLIDGALSCDDLRELLHEDHLPHEDDHEFNTIAGMLMAEFGRIPDTGQDFIWNGHHFEVIDLDGTRIDKILLTPAAVDPPDAT